MTDWLVPLTVALGSSSVIQLAVKAFSERRKVDADAAKSDADATDILARSAVAQVTDMRIELTSAREDMKAFRAALYEHQKWDTLVAKQLLELGQTVSAPPELWV